MSAITEGGRKYVGPINGRVPFFVWTTKARAFVFDRRRELPTVLNQMARNGGPVEKYSVSVEAFNG